MVGPPPHTWGTGHPACTSFHALRATPTHVGNGQKGLMPSSNQSGHPHTRGERSFSWLILMLISGPPPHTWGTGCQQRPAGRDQRATPTHVGNGRVGWFRAFFPAGHPHTRGERGTAGRYVALRTGPPPHTWGTAHGDQRPGPRPRATPTHVGNGLREHGKKPFLPPVKYQAGLSCFPANRGQSACHRP